MPRHAVAALLNASSPDVDPVPAFDTTAEVIAAFQAAFDSGDFSTTKDLFETSNESGCPLNGSSDPRCLSVDPRRRGIRAGLARSATGPRRTRRPAGDAA